MTSKPKGRVLIVDDDRIIVESLGALLRMENYDAEGVPGLSGALAAMERKPADLVITDVNMPGGNGFELLRILKQRWPETVPVMITGYGTIESAVEAIKMGAYDYLTKPIIDDEIRLVTERALNQQALLRENRELRRQLSERRGPLDLVGHDFRMQKVLELIEAVADSQVTVLIQGASGTGKSMVGRAIHHRSNRRDKAMVEVACGAIPETLLESELFGHMRGAFTGATSDKQGKFSAADGSTLFLDEIATASPSLQVKLLRAIQERKFEPVGSNETQEVDVRLIVATNVDLEEEVEAGRFRQDLFYRINVVTITMPSLADRIADVPILAEHFLGRYCQRSGKTLEGISDDALDCMARYSWPGNVRELENAVERAVVLCKGRVIDVGDLPPRVVERTATAPVDTAYRPMPLKDALEGPERAVIEAALRANGWNRQQTADVLEINRTTLYKKMKRYGLDRAMA